MKEAMGLVQEFHAKYGFPIGFQLPRAPHEQLATLGAQLFGLRDHYAPNSKPGDIRLSRVHHLLEELAELFIAMEAGNEEDTLDALCDLAYIVIGTAVVFGLPLAEGFAAVHASNMTKDAEQSRVGHPKKGESYQPPNLTAIIAAHQEWQGEGHA